jgi:hypothetical protein
MAHEDWLDRDRVAIFLKYGERCAYCGQKIVYSEMNIDHKIPKFKGSVNFKPEVIHGFDNLMPTDEECNLLKGFDDLEMFRMKLKIGQKRSERYTGFNGKFYFESYSSINLNSKKNVKDDCGRSYFGAERGNDQNGQAPF